MGAGAGAGAGAAGDLHLARRLRADAPARNPAPARARRRGGAGRLPDQRADDRHAADRLQLLQPLRRAVDRGSAQGAGDDRALPHEPHRLQARRGRLRLRDRRRLLGRREHPLSDHVPRLWRRHLAGARPRHRGDARHHARAPRGDRARARRAREPRSGERLPLQPAVVRARLSRSRSRSTPRSTNSPTGRWWR